MNIKIHFRLDILEEEIKLLRARQNLQILCSLDVHHLEEVLTHIPVLFCKNGAMLVSIFRYFRFEAFDLSSFLFKLHVHLSYSRYAVCFLKE